MGKDSRYRTGSRDGGSFLAIPHTVIDSTAYRGLNAQARAFLIDVARQYNGHNNGALLASRSHMAPLGWKSNDMLTKCTRDLLQARLLHLTVMGRRPNRAAWYAITWQKLDQLAGYDAGAAETFVRGAYALSDPLLVKPTREQLYQRWGPGGKTQPLSRPTGQEVTQ